MQMDLNVYKCNLHGKIHRCGLGGDCPLQTTEDGGWSLCKISGKRIGGRVIWSKAVVMAGDSDGEEEGEIQPHPEEDVVRVMTNAKRDLFYSMVDEIFKTKEQVQVTNAYVSELLSLWRLHGLVLNLKTNEFVIGTLYLMREYSNTFLQVALPHPKKLKEMGIQKSIITIAKKKWRLRVGMDISFKSHEDIVKVDERVDRIANRLLVRLSKDI